MHDILVMAGVLNCKDSEWGCQRSNTNGTHLPPYADIPWLRFLDQRSPRNIQFKLTPFVTKCYTDKATVRGIYCSVMSELSSDHFPHLVSCSHTTSYHSRHPADYRVGTFCPSLVSPAARVNLPRYCPASRQGCEVRYGCGLSKASCPG